MLFRWFFLSFLSFFSTLEQIAVGKDPLSECQQHHSYAQDRFVIIIPVFLTCICCYLYVLRMYLYVLRKKIFFILKFFLVIL